MAVTQLGFFDKKSEPIEINVTPSVWDDVKKPDDWKKAESMMTGYFPNLSSGIEINNKFYQLKRNNIENIYLIDWGIFNKDNDMVGAIDTEHKPGWKEGWGRYPFWSVAKYVMGYNLGKHGFAIETMKVRVFRDYPDLTFWMPLRVDYKEAGIITGRKVIESPINFRPKPVGMARDVEIFEFSESNIVFCKILEPDIEEYVISQLKKAGQFQ
jgi:hypothetical protein